MKTFHIDEPREIGKKRLKISSRDKMELKDDLTERLVVKKIKEIIKNELKK
ncbi:hypothetical protein HOB87_09765 [Candidatus Woesearchaeota archaeon]|jgi:hypothetical protein|nr:hypothetical protein [Candidatus Woesearchaeota archaeon]MBT7557034.1 hypothetical protein [Candidatus Woesearchaeota archaeon]